jgi:hypothetical protein
MAVSSRLVKRVTAASLAAGVLATVVVASSAASTDDMVGLRDEVNPTLYVNYSQANCTFTITNDSGGTVSSIAPGSYNVQITTPVQFEDGKDRTGLAPGDMSDCLGAVAFELNGPGVSIATTLDDGSNDHALFPVIFAASSSYTAVDDNQPSVARVVFTTQASGTAQQVAGPTAPAASKPTTSNDVVGSKAKTATVDPLRGTLLASVSAAGKLALKLSGKTVTTLPYGRYTVTVSDRSKTSGFILQEKNATGTTVSGSSFTGKRTVKLDMKPGQWFFYPTFVGHKTFFIVHS